MLEPFPEQAALIGPEGHDAIMRRARRLRARRHRALAAGVAGAVVVVASLAFALVPDRSHPVQVLVDNGVPSELTRAVDAMLRAKSFTITGPGGDVVYQGPDRVKQVEHGHGSSVDSNGVHRTSDDTITKIFLGTRYYELDERSTDTRPAHFTVADRCPGEDNAAAVFLQLLRAIVSDGSTVRPTGSGTYSYAATIVDRATNTPAAMSGTITVKSGRVQTLLLGSGPTRSVESTFGSINSAPPVTAPAGAEPITMTCGNSSSSGSSSSTSTASSPSAHP